MSSRSGRSGRSTAERVSLACSCAVVLVVVGLIVAQLPGEDDPAAPTTRVEQVREVGRAFHVDVVVHNDGDRTAASVQVTAELTVGGDVLTGDQTIDVLSGDEDQALTFVFGRDPGGGDLRVAVSGYAEP